MDVIRSISKKKATRTCSARSPPIWTARPTRPAIRAKMAELLAEAKAELAEG